MQYLCMLMLYPQNKYRNIVIYPQQFNSYFDNLNIDENIEIVGDDIDANLKIPRDENTEVQRMQEFNDFVPFLLACLYTGYLYII